MFGIRHRIMCSVKSWTEAEQSPKAVRAWPVHIRARGRGRRRLRSPGQRRGKKSETEAGSELEGFTHGGRDLDSLQMRWVTSAGGLQQR